MNLRLLLTSVVILLFASSTYAGAGYCSHGKNKRAAKTTVASPAEDYYDVKHLKFNINLTDTSVYVAGYVITNAVVTAPSMSVYTFELDSSFTIDSAFVNGAMLPVSAVGWVRTMTLTTALTAGTSFTAQVYYHGLPPGGTGGFFNGITHSVSSGGTHMVFTISDPYVAKNWWPCKQSIQDKIDSVDMFVTVPAHVRDGSNGVLLSIDSVSTPGSWTFHWQTHYPIDYYLISVAVAKYREYKSYWHFTASTDSVLIQNFFIDTPTFNPAYKANFDSIGMFLDYFSSLYGRYPFWREKYGVCYTTLPGGMEHQTMTTIGVPTTYIIAHELCHQWWGDNVTYQDWRDVWLSEGFATFSEAVFLERFWSPAVAKAHRQGLLYSALGSPCGRVAVTDTSNSDSLFNQQTVYNKAQAVVRMLQYIAPSDSVFYGVLKTFQQNYSLGHATTANLKALAEAAYGVPLDTFFNQWIYGRGYPIYKVSWNQSGSTVYVKLIQTRSCPSYTNHFSTPVEIQLHSLSADTFIKVYNTLDTQIYMFDWAPAMTNAYINPNVWTILKVNGAITHDTKLSVGMLDGNEFKVFPNPTQNHWELQNTNEGLALSLSDITGKILWQGKTAQGTTQIPGAKLPSGNYLLRITGGSEESSIKLVHW